MADASVYPDAVDPDQRATILSEALPAEFRDLLATMHDGIRQVQLALGTNPASSLHLVATSTATTTNGATDSYEPLDDTNLRLTIPADHPNRMLVTCQALATCQDATALQWMIDDGAGGPLSDLVTVADLVTQAPGLRTVTFVLEDCPAGEFQLRWGQMAVLPTDTGVGTSWGGDLGPAILTAKGVT